MSHHPGPAPSRAPFLFTGPPECAFAPRDEYDPLHHSSDGSIEQHLAYIDQLTDELLIYFEQSSAWERARTEYYPERRSFKQWLKGQPRDYIKIQMLTIARLKDGSSIELSRSRSYGIRLVYWCASAKSSWPCKSGGALMDLLDFVYRANASSVEATERLDCIIRALYMRLRTPS